MNLTNHQLAILLYNLVSKIKHSKTLTIRYSYFISHFLSLELDLLSKGVENQLDIKVPAAFSNVYFPNKKAHEDDLQLVNALLENSPNFAHIEHLLNKL